MLKDDERSIEKLEKIIINNVEQWILTRGEDKNNPILLYLHGGPGAPEMFNRSYQRALEKHYTVVNWEQRGAGKSYSKDIPLETMNIEQFISDAYELIQILRKRFNKEKIYLMGHSWGSYLGMLMIKKYPELFYAYIGVGQIVNSKENEEISYKYTLEKAKLANNKQALRDLEAIGLPPYEDKFKSTIKQRKWLAKFGGVIHSTDKIGKLKRISISLCAKEYGLFDYIKFIRGSYFSLKSDLYEELMKINLFEEVQTVEIPIYFCTGRYDFCTSAELTERYYNFVNAPRKELIWFEESAHSPNIEECDKFCDVIVDKILKETYAIK